jgi:predicted nuclease of predicted toxin-antitoxin system
MTKIMFLADADLNEDIVTGILRREPAIDFQTATAAGLEGLPDPEVLAIAAEGGRVLVSHDRKTMPQHFADFIAMQNSPGLLIVSQRAAVETAIEELILIWAASELDEWINIIASIPL